MNDKTPETPQPEKSALAEAVGKELNGGAPAETKPPEAPPPAPQPPPSPFGQIPPQLMLTPQECLALAEMTANAPANNGQMKRTHIRLEEKMLALGRFLSELQERLQQQQQQGGMPPGLEVRPGMAGPPMP